MQTFQQPRSLRQFFEQTAENDDTPAKFELESERILEIKLEDQINIKAGTMLAYKGAIKFTREGILDQGLGSLFKKSITGEGIRITYATGSGRLYLGEKGKKIILLNLDNEEIVVNGNDVLAFDPSLHHSIKLLRSLGGLIAGGLFNVRIGGTGMLAITSHYEPLTLRVTPGQPVFTDPGATIAWSASLDPKIKTDISVKTFFGRGSGESLQLKFEGDGYVVIQPFEESPLLPQNGRR